MTDADRLAPRERIEQEVRDRGRAAVVEGCIRLLEGDADVDPTLIHALGGAPARWAVAGGDGGPDYWLRVWAARGLLWAWDDRAVAAVERALADPAWRVREMAAKVARRHLLADLVADLESLRTDPVRRVATAAERAVVRIVATGG